jgi:hypothetical protein
MRFDIRQQIRQAFPRMIAGAQVMHITNSTLDWVGAGTIGRRKEQAHAWMVR